jgi:membrane protein
MLLLTLVLVLLAAAVLLALVLTGPVAQTVGDAIGIGSTAVTVWQIAKWPAMLVVVMVMLAILYYWAPNAKQPKFKWITPGSVLAVVLWVIASAAFAFYVAHFNSYNKTYGTLGGVIAFLVWMWISNIAVLLGAELNAEVERGRELAAGIPGADRDIQLPYRKRPKDAPPRPEDEAVGRFSR